jgi:ribosome-binding factor A
MKDIRIKRLSKQIQKDLSEILSNLNRDYFRGKMISVSEVRLTQDLSIAKVFLSIFPSENSEEILKQIEAMTKQIRFELGNRIRHQVRKIPELRFSLDKTFDEIEKIDKLLNKDKKKDDNE